MQFLDSALFSNELKALYILLPPAHLTNTFSTNLTEHTTLIHVTRRHG